MTSTELIQKAIHFEEVPRTPVAVLDGYSWMLKKSGMTYDDLFARPAGEAVDFILQWYDRLGSDMVYANPTASRAAHQVMSAVTGSTPPLKKASDISLFSPEKVFDEAKTNPLFQTLAAHLEQMNEKLAGAKPIMAFAAGPLTSAGGFMGMENLMMALYEDDEQVERLLDFCTEYTILSIRFQIAHGATGISIADPVSAVNLISEEFFERFTLPRLKRITAAFADSGLPIMLHICGASAPRLKPLIGSGIHIYSLDAVDLAEALDTAKGSFAIFGNLNTFDVMLNKTADEVYEISRQRCELAAKKGGFILAPGCDLPPDTPEDNILAMTRAAGE